MYYFMDRYRHARRAFDRFVYMSGDHPRLGDAVKEYLHTYEKLDPGDRELLNLYETFSRRRPRTLIHDETSVTGLIRNADWLALKSASLLLLMGRYRQAAQSADAHQWGGHRCRLAHQALRAHHATTGRLWTPKWLLDWDVWGEGLIAFEPGQADRTLTLRPTRPEGWYRNVHTRQRFKYFPRNFGRERDIFLLAPSGKVFRSIRVTLTADRGGAGRVLLSKDARCDLADRRVRFGETGEAETSFENLPRTGMLQMCLLAPPGGPTLRSVRARATFEHVGRHGAIDVACANAAVFSVRMDGRHERRMAGLIGPVAPGDHTLEIRGLHPAGPHGAFKTRVTVRPGKVASVVAHLPWKKGGPWSAWTAGTLIGRDYPSRCIALKQDIEVPFIQADEGAIRVVWSYAQDLWMSVSKDGGTFSRPWRIPMPVSSGWSELNPRLRQAEDGRFVLIFHSNRNGQYKFRHYVSWSRDLVHWSAPAAVDRESWSFAYGPERDGSGRQCLGRWAPGLVEVVSSEDGLVWKTAVKVQPPRGHKASFQRLVRREGGVLELVYGLQQLHLFTARKQPVS
jgi:hypothetical protein